jgi:NADH-quinone oxidoreductase subunit G
MSEDTLQIEVNGQTLTARKGQNLIEVTDAAGITVPRFCYHEKLPIAANCRMCLVDVEKMPKPVPACATPVMDGMVVRTASERALDAQKAVMEFLLINHPLDCPVCDEGGECDLQDTALGYGQVVSRYKEAKRTVAGKNLGTLIATEMTRCIHCTRCVRFGEEVGGIQELGGTGRGEQLRIGTYVEKAIESEVSGNMIDLCPVGALTSKPFRFTARSWELQRRPSVSFHDSLGSNLEVHSVQGEVKRVVPRTNEAVNEIWLSDRDRFSYTALNADDRLLTPEIKEQSQWREASWEEALELAASKIENAVGAHGADKVGALVGPGQSNEDYFLLQQLMRGLGSSNIDHRTRQGDFSGALSAGAVINPNAVDNLQNCDVVVLVGSNLRKDQPLLWVRVRNALRDHGIKLVVINPQNYDLTIEPDYAFVGSPDRMSVDLGALIKLLPGGDDVVIDGWQDSVVNDQHRQAANAIGNAVNPCVVIGNQAFVSDGYSVLRDLALALARQVGTDLVELSYGANSHGAWQAGAVPHRGPGQSAINRAGLDAREMFDQPLSAYLMLGVEPEYDCWNAAASIKALEQAETVVVLNAYVTQAMRDYADVLLPIAPFTEHSGSMVNLLGMRQHYRANVKPKGSSRPAWKVLRVMADHLGIKDCGYADLEQLTAAFVAAQEQTPVAVTATTPNLVAPPEGLVRIGDAPIYAVDGITRRSKPLQQRADSLTAAVYLSQDTLDKVGATEQLLVTQGEFQATLPVIIDDRVAAGCVYIPGGVPGTELLGPLVGPVTLAQV